jgi:hypothetical protein
MKEVSTVVVSSSLALFQIGMVCFFAVFLHRSSEEKLRKLKKSVNNMYKSIDFTSKIRVFYASVFYIVRTAVVLIIVTKPSFGI